MAHAQAGASYKPYSPRNARTAGPTSTPPSHSSSPGPSSHRHSLQQPPPQPRFQHAHSASLSDGPSRTGSPHGPHRAGTSTPPGPSSSHSYSRPVSPTKPNAPMGTGSALGRVRGQMPYRSDFQPQGVRRDRTEQFEQLRRAREEGHKLEVGRLGRRLEKLVALHFGPSAEEKATPARSSPIPSLAELNTLRTKSAKDIWRSVASGGKSEIEKEEQGIVKWENDSTVSHCPICTAAFSLSTRRHHCRLCGRVVCFLPPSSPNQILIANAAAKAGQAAQPTRRERCSTFFTYEWEAIATDREGEKVGQGVVVEVAPVEREEVDLREAMNEVRLREGKKEAEIKDERKKVRVCRECLNTVLREQAKSLPVRTPAWLKLHAALDQIEKQIEDILPDFQELILTVHKPSAIGGSSHTPSASSTQRLRQTLMTSLGTYDTLAKKIKELPLTDGGQPGGSQDRLQRAIAARAQMFLQEKLMLLRSLGTIEEGDKKERERAAKPVEGESTVQTLASLLGKEDPTRPPPPPQSEAGGQLAVLLEQERLVQSYVDDANARRQFEDAASLQQSLDELRAEIRRVRASTA